MLIHYHLHTIIVSLLLPTLVISEYIAATITPLSFIISQYCSYNIVLYRNNNPISSQFIFPVSTVPTTSYIELNMPSAYTVISNTTTPMCFFTATSVPLSCTVNTNNNTITIRNVFTTSSMQTAQIISITINNIKNPSRAESSGNFQYYIKKTDGTIIDQSPSATSGLYDTSITFQPANFTSCAISANANYISTRSRLTFTITTNNAIPANGLLIIEVPLTWDGDLDQSNTIASAPTCTPMSGLSSITCSHTILQPPINIARVTVVFSSTGVSAGTQFIFDVSSILTPPYTNYQLPVSLYSGWSDGTKIDTCTSTISNTIPIPFRSVSFNVQSGTTVVQSKFTAKLDLTLAKSFSSSDEIALFLPNNFLTNNQISISSSNYAIFSTTVQTSTTSNTTTKVLLSNFPAAPSVLPANNIFTLFLTNITNYISTQPQTITIIFYRQSQSYQSSSTSYSSTIGTLTSFTIASDSVAVNYVGDSLLTISSQFSVDVGSYLEIVYNSAITAADMSAAPISFAALNGVRISNASYVIYLNTITVSNIFQRQFTSGLIQVRIPQFTNPSTVKPTPYTLTIKTSTTYAIASSVYTYTAALQAFKSGSANLTAGSYKVMDTGVSYSLTFQTYYGFKSVSILIPPEISTNVGFQTTCTPNTYTSCAITNSDIAGYKNLTFIGSTAAGLQTISWGNNINPNSFKPTSSFELFTYSGGWGVEKSTGYIILTMNQQADILSASVVPSSYKNNDVINVEINYTLPARSPNGTITFIIPDVIDISGSTCSGVDACTIIPPRITISFTNLNTSITHPYALVLTNVRNAPSFKPNGNINMTLVSSDSYASLSTTFTTWTNIQLSQFTTAVSSDVGYRGENGLFTFNIGGLSGKQTYINIKININFGALTTAPLSSTLVTAYQVRYSIVGQGTSQQSFILQTPIYIGDYTFTLKTYTSDEYPMGESTSNVWRHSCYGTECRACSGSSCLNCYNSSLSQFYIFNTADSTCIRACSIGFYLESATNNCIPCSTNCLECINSSTTCTKCPIYTNTTPSTVYYLNTIFNTCVLQCSTTYYPNTITQRCSPCVQPCYTCSDDNVCRTCVNGYYLLAPSSCLLTCPVNVMVPNNINKTCDYCSTNCLTCSIFAYNCTACNNTNDLYLQGNVCVAECSAQKFLKNNICTQCESPCRICYNSTTTCSQCYPNSTLPLWYDYKCISVSECAIGHFVNSVNGSCDLCPAQCQACISLTNCSACAAGFYLYANACIPTCPNITYNNNATLVCDPCVGCVTCTSATVCTSCRSIQYFYLSTCKSACPNGTYPSTEVTTGNSTRAICAVCPNDCPTCQNSSFCLTCLASQYLYRGTCYTICPTSTFPNSPNCTNCPATCATCSSLTNCLTCATNYSLQNSRCVLTCSQGISYNQVCYPCGLNCALCENTTCLRCDPYYYLLNNVCMSQCSANTLTLDNMTCVACTEKYVNCTTCNQTHCLSCSEGQLTLGQCLPCVPGYYTLNSKCVLCPSSCTICNNPNYCTSCKNNYYIQANFCVATCPKNKFPNGTKCDVCTPNCAICNLVTTGCTICVGGMFQFEGYCVEVCPDPYVSNLNKTLCVTQQAYSQEYSVASKPIYFPFTIAFCILIAIGIALKCYVKTMHLATFLVSVLAWVEMACWILFGVIQYLFYVNQQKNALKGIILVVAALATLIISNLIFLRFYFKYFLGDAEFEKWYRKHYCVNGVLVVLGAVFNFKAHRIIYSKVMDRDEFSMVLSSAKKIIPISILSIVSILVSSGPIIVGACFAIYYSLNQDQQFFNALDTLAVTGIMIILMLLDLRHSPNYFIDEHETQNLRNKMYIEDYESFSINNKQSEKFKGEDFEKGSNQSRQNLVDAADPSNILDNLTTAKKFRVNKKSASNIKGGEFGETLRQNNNIKKNLFSGEESKNQLLKPEQEYKQQDIDDEQQPQVANKWVEKQFDHHGYLMKYDDKNNLIRYDKNGNRVQIDENGEHKKYDAEGYLLKEDPQTGKIKRYDAEGFIVGEGNSRLDERGYKVVKSVDENGVKSYKYYDENGYEVIKDPETNQQIKLDSKGNKVVIDPITKQHKSYNKQGYQIIYGKDESQNKYKNENGQYVRYNEKTKKWEEYDPEDGFLLVKNDKGQYQKLDQHGFRVEKDQFGNIYRYDRDGYRVIFGANGLRRFDKQGYQIKRDPITGQEHRYDDDGFEVKTDEKTGEKIFYNSDGYRVERDFYGKVTLYDEQDNLVILDPVTKKYRKFNKEGLEIIDDGKGDVYLKDKRGRKVVQFEEGYYEKYDQQGNKIWLDGEGYEVETDENGNTNRYDKVGDLVNEDDQSVEQNKNQKDGWQLDQGQGDNLVLQKPSKQKKTNKFKLKKQYNHEEQYNKMVQQSKPHLIFDLEQEEQEEENLKQFHDVQPVKQYELEKQYQTLYETEAQNQLIKRQLSQGNLKINLEQLAENDYTPYTNLKEKIKKNKNKSLLSKNEDDLDESDLVIEPEQTQSKLELKSVADASVDERSFENEGVQPISQKSHSESGDLESVEEINAGPNMSKNRNRKSRRSEANFDKSSQVGGTKSENNYLQNSTKTKGKKEVEVRKIFDSDQQVQSLQEQQWQNQKADIFYKDNNSNYKTNTHEKPGQIEDQEDILSDYIPQQPMDEHHHKASEQNLLHRRYMQSIEEVEDQLFQKLKSEDHRVKRNDFKLSGTPNPLVEYAKTIEVKKIQEQKSKPKDRYAENKNNFVRRK